MRADAPQPVRSHPARIAVGLATTVLVAAIAGWEGVQGRFSTASHASILAVVATIVLLAVAVGRGRQRAVSRAWISAAVGSARRVGVAWRTRRRALIGTVGWVVLLAGTAGWDTASFVEQERSLPTLSRLFGAVTGHDWGRALVFAAWLALGLSLALGWRRPRSGAQKATQSPHAAALRPRKTRRLPRVSRCDEVTG